MLEQSQVNLEVSEIADRMEAASTDADFLEQVYKVFDIYGVGHGCLHSIHQPYSPAQALWRVTPDDVTNACSYLVESRKHPALAIGMNRHHAFDLFEFREHFKDDPDIEALYRSFENNDVNHAYGLPIQTADRGTYVFVVARPGSPIDMVELLTLQAICSNAVNGVKQFLRKPVELAKSAKLTGAQRQMLLEIAGGHSAEYLSGRMNLSELTIRSQLDHIVEKLGGKNLSHAIVLALIEGEISLDEISLVRSH